MDHIIIPKGDVYDEYFQLYNATHKCVYRDVYVDLQKNCKQTLLNLARVCNIKNRNKMKKNELVDILDKRVVFE